MATIRNDDELLLARIGYKQVPNQLRLFPLLTNVQWHRNYDENFLNGLQFRTPSPS
jgi:hypothetical protein